MRRKLELVLATIILTMCACGRPPQDGARQIGEITAIGSATAPNGATTVRARADIGASDPAILRLYGWPPEQAAAVRDAIVRDGGRLGQMALFGFSAAEVLPGAPRRVEMAAVARPGWLYAIAIDPVSQSRGGQFTYRSVRLDFGRAQ